MNGVGFILSATLAALCGQPLSAGDGEKEFSRMAERIAVFSRNNDINKVAVLSFEPKGGTARSEADYVAESIASFLAGRDRPALIERTLLEKVLREARLNNGAGGDTAAVKELRDLFSLDAVVTGTVFSDSGKLKVLARMIEVRSGRVLLAERAEIEREWRPLSELPEIDIEWDPAQWAIPAQGLRDAVADVRGPSCTERRARLAGMNSELVDAKARHWAGRMREPGFTIRSLSRNPGSEITDPGVKARFYSLLNQYYNAPAPPAPAAEQQAGLEKLMKEENSFYNECGSH